ncbi:MAG: hypothetical protein K9M15_02080 [Candidatus Marinimicrobia bacterium]|nr:hypothetical protein [Candidatus Neomarinimicrobiota bacterium]
MGELVSEKNDSSEEGKKKIYCCECGRFVGAVKYGSLLLKDLSFVCSKCREAWKSLKIYVELQRACGQKYPSVGSDMMSSFESLFGTKPKK